MDVSHYFKKRKILPEKLVAFGFVLYNKDYIYKTMIVQGQFKMSVTLSQNGMISAEVTDTTTEDAYILHLIGVQGGFAGKVRKEYENILAEINSACFENDVFKSNLAQEVILYVRQTYKDELEFLWKKFPSNAVFRRQDTAKWYAALLIIPKYKLGLESQNMIEILDLRIQPEKMDSLIDRKKYFPGYHMNKKNWFTILLDGSVSIEEISQKIDNSYRLAKK